jgi:hypothetical protein
VSHPVAFPNGNPVTVPTDGCSDNTNGCLEFSPGYYSTGISYSGAKTMLFDPGIYYLDGSLSVTGTATLRMGTHSQKDGVMFYFHQGTLNIGSNTGKTAGLTSVASSDITCDGALPPGNLGIPALLTGNVLTAQCTSNGTYFDNYADTSDSSGNIRGVLFFQEYSNSSSAPVLYGNNVSMYTGSEYFHNSTYGVNLSLTSGTADALTTWGNIVVDNLTFAGTNEVRVLLGGVGTAPVARIAMVQ